MLTLKNLVKLPQLGVLTYGLTGTLKIWLNSDLWLTGSDKWGVAGLRGGLGESGAEDKKFLPIS